MEGASNMIFKKDTNGYMYSYSPDHYCANKAGKVYEHVKVMADHIGRRLLPDECVHHIDRDRTNNSLENLMLLTIEAHARLHAIEDRCTKFVSNICKTCQKSFETTEGKTRDFCSVSCVGVYYQKFTVSPEELEILVWTYPTVQVAEMFGVSDTAIAKKCKKFNISKPPRGYWRKLETGNI